MNSGDYTYIWQLKGWPDWQYDLVALAGPLSEVSRAQGLLLGRLADVGMTLRDQASLAALTEDVIKTSEIEGERLDAESVRSSIARRLGVDIGALAPVDRHVEGVVEMVLDATARCETALTAGSFVRLACCTISHWLQRACANSRRDIARRRERPHASCVWPDWPTACSL